MKLLIVDDNKYVVTLLRRQLNWEAFGIEELIGVYSVEEAKEALNLCHRQIAEALRKKDKTAGKDALERHFRMIDEILEKHEKTHSM